MSLIAELEEALKTGTPEKRVDTLRRVTDLFLNESDRLNEDQIHVFDDVMVHLVRRIESKALIQLSESLAPVDRAPVEVIRRLARDDEIAVAGPVLTQSERLPESDLIEIAQSKGPAHLLAISGRTSLTEALTDILVERGDQDVARRLAGNAGARFSDAGFATIVRRAGADDSLTEKLGRRLDIPLHLLRQLLLRATDLVRSRLLASVAPAQRGQLQEALASIANEVARESSGQRDYRPAESLVLQMNRNGQLNEAVLTGFIQAHQYEEVTATLALFCNAPVSVIERLMKHVSPDGLIVACKSAKLSWHTVSSILKIRFAHHSISDQEFEEAKQDFLTLSQAAAQRAFRFILVKEAAQKAG